MDWRTILAVAVSVVLIIAVPMLLPVIFPGNKTAQTAPTSTPAPAAPATAAGQQAAAGTPQATAPPASTQAAARGGIGHDGRAGRNREGGSRPRGRAGSHRAAGARGPRDEHAHPDLRDSPAPTSPRSS